MRKLTHIKVKRRHLFVLFAVIIVAIGLGIVSAVQSANGPGPTPVVFSDVTPATLESAGIDLTQTTNPAPLSSQEVAESAAASYLNNADIREAHFAHCSVANVTPPINEDCWAVSLSPAGFVSHGPSKPMSASYLIALVDPNTGRVLLGEAGRP